jgi:predicted phosphodiesterase
MLGGYSASVMAGGHTHSQMLRRYADMPIVNVGSIGLAGVNPGSPELAANRNVDWAEYGVLRRQNGRLRIELCRTLLKMAAVRAAAYAAVCRTSSGGCSSGRGADCLPC